MQLNYSFTVIIPFHLKFSHYCYHQYRTTNDVSSRNTNIDKKQIIFTDDNSYSDMAAKLKLYSGKL